MSTDNFEPIFDFWYIFEKRLKIFSQLIIFRVTILVCSNIAHEFNLIRLCLCGLNLVLLTLIFLRSYLFIYDLTLYANILFLKSYYFILPVQLRLGGRWLTSRLICFKLWGYNNRPFFLFLHSEESLCEGRGNIFEVFLKSTHWNLRSVGEICRKIQIWELFAINC